MLGSMFSGTVAANIDHTVYGWGFFSVVMLAMLWLANQLPSDPPPPPPRDNAHPMAAQDGGVKVGLTVFTSILTVVAGPAYAAIWMAPSTIPTANSAWATSEPISVSWHRLEMADNAWSASVPSADRTLVETYRAERHPTDRAEGPTATLYIAWFSRQREGAEVVHFTNRLHTEEAWRVIQQGSGIVAAGYEPAMLEHLVGSGGQRRLAAGWYWVGGRLTGSATKAKLLQAFERLFGQDRPAAVVAISAPYDETPTEAMEVLSRFLAASVRIEHHLAKLPTMPTQ